MGTLLRAVYCRCGRAVPSGHYIAEEIPDLLVNEIMSFFASE